jgi:hypothetical protein
MAAPRFFRYPRKHSWAKRLTVPFRRVTLWTSASEESTHPYRADSALHFLINSLWAWPIDRRTSKRWFLRCFSCRCKEGQNKSPSDVHPPYWRGSADRFAESVARFSSRAVRVAGSPSLSLRNKWDGSPGRTSRWSRPILIHLQPATIVTRRSAQTHPLTLFSPPVPIFPHASSCLSPSHRLTHTHATRNM